MRKEKSKKSFFKKVLSAVGLLVLILAIWQYELIFYGVSQGTGQLSIIWNAKPIEEVLKDPLYPDSVKQKIKLVQEIRQFAFDSLGINHSDNYTTFYDQGGKPILWVVTGSEPYKLKAKEWTFPILGAVTYKGFFEYPKAEKEKGKLLAEGFDTSVGEVEGWSTLGWFKDPILSNMLDRPVGSLANLIIHELTHGTLYIKNNVQYNENLASFVGDKGALMFLEYKYGKDSDEYADYVKRKDLWKNYSLLVLNSADRLDSLYASFTPNTSTESKKLAKDKLMKELIAEFKTYLAYLKDRDPEFYAELDSINNAYFIDFRTYRQDQNTFEEEFEKTFNSDFRAYFKYLKDKYPSL